MTAPIMAILLSISNLVFGRMIVGKERQKLYNTDAKYLHIAGTVILLIVAFCTLGFVDVTDEAVMKWYWLTFVIILFSFQSILEWKFLKESGEHKVSLLTLCIGIIYILLFMF